MRKMISKIAGLMLGLSLAAGVGLTLGTNSKQETKATSTGEISVSSVPECSTTNGTQVGSLTLSSSPSITLSVNTDGNNGKFYGTGTEWRLYQTNNPQVVLTIDSSYVLDSVSFKYTNSNTGVLTYNSTQYSSDASITLGGTSNTATFGVGNTGSATNGQVKVKSVTVEYSAAGGGGGDPVPVLQSISVSNEKTSYGVGDEFVKPTVTATYDIGDPEDVTSSATCSGYNMNVAGDYTVTVSYGGKTTTYDIVVNDPEPVGETLYSCDFRTVAAYSYTKNKEFTLEDKSWTVSMSQVASSVFYLGTNTNASNAPHGILNDNDSFADVVTALAAEDSAYSSNVSAAHAYAMRFNNAYNNVGEIRLKWDGANNAFQIYLFGNSGSGLSLIAHTEAENGTSVSGSLRWVAPEYGIDFTSFVIVARPGTSGSTATSKTFKASTFAIYEGEAEPVDPTKKDMVIYTSGNPAAGGSFYYSKNAGTHVFSAYENSDLVSGVTWSVSDDTVATINSSTGAVTTLKPGDVTIYAEAEGYNKASAAVHFIKGALEELDITGSMTKREYLVGEAWDPTGFTVTGTYHSGWEEDVTSIVSWTYNPASPAVSVTAVTATATLDEISDSSSAQTVSVTKTNPLQAIYSMAANASVDVYGVFVGNKDANNIIIMDGAYGMDVYKSGCGTNSYVEGETILHVTGKVSIFNGLYEIAGTPTITEVSSADVETPVTYTSHGSETAEYASRVTTVTGVPSVTKGDLTADPAAADITLSFSVAGTPVQVFYKKATQTREDMDTIKAAVDGSNEMTVKGFTAWYNGFQVQMTGLVEAVETYTAEDFSQDLLDQTDAVCEGYKDGDNNHDALVAIWNNLASNDKYPSLPTAQKTILAEAERNESGTVVEQAMARYDYLTGKYNLNNFINGRTPVVVAGSQLISTANINNNSSTIVIVVVALTSITSIGVLLVIKRKRSLVK